MGLADLGEYSIIKSKHTNRSAWPLSGGPVSERRELSMTKKERARLAVNALKNEYPDAICSLRAEEPLQLLIATRLSAQCTDARVNLVTPVLFEKYPTLEAFCEANVEDVEEIIHSCGFIMAKRGILWVCPKKSAIRSAALCRIRWKRSLPCPE